MSLILNIDTAVEGASVSLAFNGKKIAAQQSAATKDSASWLHPAINEMFDEVNMSFTDLAAVAVSAGPGSYTGLRVGMAAAKGICYALNIPLLCINTLKILASAALNEPADLYAPMIDARRMEVFTAVYDAHLQEIVPPANVILTEENFQDLLATNKILFFANGSKKFEPICTHQNALFREILSAPEDMIKLSWEELQHKKFADLAYSEPFYGKEFYSPMTKQ